MTLLAIVIALFLVSQQWVPTSIKERRWLRLYLVWFERLWRSKNWPVGAQYVIYLAPLVIAAWGIDVPLYGWYWQLTDLILSVLLLCSALDYRTVETRLHDTLRRWRSQDWEAAWQEGKDYWSYSKNAQATEMVNQTLIGFLIKTNQRLFSPLFWYVLFGLGGLMFYVLGRVAAKNSYRGKGDEPARAWRKVAYEFQQVLDGFVARVVVLTVGALLFNFKAVAIAVRRFRATDREADVVLRMAVRVVLNFSEWPESVDAVASEGVRRGHQLLELRSNLVLLWLIVLALFTLAGWVLH